jgi:hypothetical protein
MPHAVALACPVCSSAKDEANRAAFLGTTVFLTGLPIAMIGGLIYWVARRASAQQGEDPGKDADQGAPRSAERPELHAVPRG